MTDWRSVLHTISPQGRASIVAGFADAMPRLIELADLTTPLRQAHFLAQCCHESDGLHTTEEYASGRSYEGRRDLGNTEPGDGARFKGRGVIQLTGRANYEEYGEALDVDLVGNPGKAGQAPVCYETAALFWKKKNLNRFADADDVLTITKRINGGTNGIESRRGYLRRAKSALRAAPAIVGLLSADLDGDSAGRVIAAQRLLRDKGYWAAGAPDGVLGPATRSAIFHFQSENGLPATGDLDDATMDALYTAAPRSLPDSRTDATEADLRVKGSETITNADQVQGNSNKIGATAAIAGAGAGLDVLSGITEKVQKVQDVATGVDASKSFLASHWPAALLLVGAAFLIWWAWQNNGASKLIKALRVADHRAGKNMGR